jgi:hypothetical protein
VSKPEELNIFTELLNRLHEIGFKITKANYDMLNENLTDFEVHVTYSDGGATWFFAFSCSSDGICKVREEDVGMDVVLKAPSVDAFINNAFNIITSLKNAQKDIRSLAEKIKQALGAGARLDDLKTEVFLNKYYGEPPPNEGLMQIMLLPLKAKINIEVSLTNWNETKLLSLIVQLDDVLRRQIQ